jgi:hypothetical protein
LKHAAPADRKSTASGEAGAGRRSDIDDRWRDDGGYGSGGRDRGTDVSIFEAAGRANVLVFPDLTSANTCYKLLSWIGGAEKIGPILMGMSKPVHVPQRGCEVKEIVNLAAIAVVDAQETEVALDAELKAAKTAKNAGHADAAGAMVQHSESRAWKAQLGEATEGRGKNRSVAQLEGNVIE